MTPTFPQDGVMAVGPSVIDGPERRHAWRVAFGGLSSLQIVLRPNGSADRTRNPVMQTSLSTQHELAPGMATSQFIFDFIVLRGNSTELLIEHAADLTPTEIAIPNLESQQSLPSAGNGAKRLLIRLREPVRSGQLRISATSPVPYSEAVPWVSPKVQIVGAIPRAETIRLRISPELNLVDWKPGSFRFLRNEFAADRTQVLTLEAQLQPEGQAAPTRPSAHFRPPGTEFNVRQQIDWDLAIDRVSLNTHLWLSVQRGTLSLIELRLPAGYDVESVECPARSESNPHWSVGAGASPKLRVEFSRPLTPGLDGEIVVRLRLMDVNFARGAHQAAPFPDVVPLRVRQRQGEFAVHVGPAYLASAPQPPELSNQVGPQP